LFACFVTRVPASRLTHRLPRGTPQVYRNWLIAQGFDPDDMD
jgi:hypothetical protein